MGKTQSKEEVIIAQNANGAASASTIQHHTQKLEIIEILIGVAVFLLMVALIYHIIKKCNKHFVRTIQRELNRNNIATMSRTELTTSAV